MAPLVLFCTDLQLMALSGNANVNCGLCKEPLEDKVTAPIPLRALYAMSGPGLLVGLVVCLRVCEAVPDTVLESRT
eukprot:670293-Rhodomonas_salina.2